MDSLEVQVDELDLGARRRSDPKPPVNGPLRLSALAKSNDLPRARTHAVSVSVRACPVVDAWYKDVHDLKFELGLYFALVEPVNVPSIVLDTDTLDALIAELPDEKAAEQLFYFGFGCMECQAEIDAEAAEANCAELCSRGALSRLKPSECGIFGLGLLYGLAMAESTALAPELDELGYTNVIFHLIAELRWQDLDTAPLLPNWMLVLRSLILSVLGAEPERVKANLEKHSFYKLDVPVTKPVTPLELYQFQEMVRMRYPSYSPPEPRIFDPVDIALNIAPHPHVCGVPASVLEACELLEKETRTSAEYVEYALEKRAFARANYGAQPSTRTEPCARIHSLYTSLLPDLKAFCRVTITFLLHSMQPEGPPYTEAVHACVSVIKLLLQWFKVSHVLKAESLCCMLHDLQFQLVVCRYVSQYPVVESLTSSEPNITSHWNRSGDNGGVPTRQLEGFSQIQLEVYIGLLSTLGELLRGKPKRISAFAELPCDGLKQLMAVYNKDLWQVLLDVFKMQLPHTSKKWRGMNMEVISAIYMHCNLTLLDNLGLNENPAQGAAAELALRELVEFYNERLG